MSQTDKNAIAVTTDDRQTNNIFSTPHSSEKPLTRTQQLLVEVQKLPDGWGLTPVGNNKAALGDDWQKTPLTKQDFEHAVQIGHFKQLIITPKNVSKSPFCVPSRWMRTVGVICGRHSEGLVFVDHDGSSCDELIERLSGISVAEALPKTPTVTSGRPGRYQSIYRVPEKFWEAISTKKIQTNTVGNDGKPEQLELRWDGCQSNVVGYHPQTGSYFWLPGLAPWECEVAEAPAWIIAQMWKHMPSRPHAKGL